jgi:hypothetical protein
MFIFPAVIRWNEQNKKLDKQPAIKSWRDLATTDPAQLAQWWHDFPDAAPGIELGRSRLFVVDLDRHPGGADGVAAFKGIRGNNPAPSCPTVKTPSNGFHLYFRQPDGETLGNGRGSLPAGIDIRGDGGWTVAPGASFKQWRWRVCRNGSPPQAPDWIIGIIRKPRIEPARQAREWKPCGDAWLRGLVGTVINAAVGERNNSLFWASCRAGEAIRDGKANEGFVVDVLIEAAMRAGWPERKAKQTIQNGIRRR